MDKLSYNISSIKKVKRVKRAQAVLLPALETVVWEALKRDQCPVCGRKAYWNRAQTLIYCKSKEHNFALPRASYEEIVSGKRLNEWKQFNNLMKR